MQAHGGSCATRASCWLIASWILIACGSEVTVLAQDESNIGGGNVGGEAPVACALRGGVCGSKDLPCERDERWASPEEAPCGGESLACCLPRVGTCTTPKPLDLSTGSWSEEGDTSTFEDDFPSIHCESPNAASGFDQGQVYFEATLEAGQTYQFTLTTSFYGFVYVFPSATGCDPDGIQSACSSDGDTGMVSGIVNPGSTGISTFTPSQTADFVMVVDSDTSTGPFSFAVDLL